MRICSESWASSSDSKSFFFGVLTSSSSSSLAAFAFFFDALFGALFGACLASMLFSAISFCTLSPSSGSFSAAAVASAAALALGLPRAFGLGTGSLPDGSGASDTGFASDLALALGTLFLGSAFTAASPSGFSTDDLRFLLLAGGSSFGGSSLSSSPLSQAFPLDLAFALAFAFLASLDCFLSSAASSFFFSWSRRVSTGTPSAWQFNAFAQT